MRNISQVYNILDKNREKCNEIDRIIFEDPDKKAGFIILPDLKWDQKNNRDLYCQALVHDRSLHSLRDLTADHLILLENLYEKGRAAVAKHYNFDVSFSLHSSLKCFRLKNFGFFSTIIRVTTTYMSISLPRLLTMVP